MDKPTLALSLITNNTDNAIEVINEYGSLFDKVYVTVAATSKSGYGRLRNYYSERKNIKVSYFKWCDDFGAARRYNHKQIKTDYFFWLDDDDSIEHPERLRDLVATMSEEGLDCVYLKYNYFQNAVGEGINDHWRERLIKTDSALVWADVPVHETMYAPSGYAAQIKSDWVTVHHHKSEEDLLKSAKRNKELLVKHWSKVKDPRTAFYLGESYLAEGDYPNAVQMFEYLVANGGWDEQKYTALCRLADCSFLTNDYPMAIVYTDMAIALDPKEPDAYFQKVIIYGLQEQWNKAIEWSKVALSKSPNTNTLQMIDPTKYLYKGQFIAAQAYLFAGQADEAYKLYSYVKQTAPHFIKEQSVEVRWDELFEQEYYDQKAINYTKWLTYYLNNNDGDAGALFRSLPGRVFSDPRLNAERIIAYPPVKWPERSIAIYCGPGTEVWGPDTLAEGMGGSEEAIVYLSRELAQQHQKEWAVVVYNERDEEFIDNPDLGSDWVIPVTYKPWSTLNPHDEFDVFIAWRAPENARGVKARKVICDLHDVVPKERVYEAANYIDTFMVKSKYHRNLYPDLPDNKFVIIGNGIVKEQFE